MFSILYSLRNVNNFFQKFLYILQAGENSHRSSACDCFTFLFRFAADLSPQQVRRSILFMREQPHGAAQNSSSETRLLYVCLVIYTVCRRTRCILHQNRKPSENPRLVQCIASCARSETTAEPPVQTAAAASTPPNRNHILRLFMHSLLSGSPVLLILYRRMSFLFCDTLPQKFLNFFGMRKTGLQIRSLDCTAGHNML